MKNISRKSISFLMLSAWLGASIQPVLAADNTSAATLSLSQAMSEAQNQSPDLKRVQAASLRILMI
jgi:hypothetical protein